VFVKSFDVQNAEAMFNKFSFVETYNLNASPEIVKLAEKTIAQKMATNIPKEVVVAAIKEVSKKPEPAAPVTNDKPLPRTPAPEAIVIACPDKAAENLSNWAYN
jgi:hypothetical protein